MPRFASRAAFRPTASSRRPTAPRAFTLIEMLIAVAITLVMMTAVVTLFANISESVRSRRSTMEMSAQLRTVRTTLQQDLAGHTCPGTTWQTVGANHGYIEYIEGPHRDGYVSQLIEGNVPSPADPEIDHTTSLIPTSNIPLQNGWITNGGGLGDFDDALAFTSRNEDEPFVGRVPDYAPASTNGFTTLESPLAEVIWFTVENPGYTDASFTRPANGFFGEPGMRTIYRRALVIAPWVDPYGAVNAANSHPGIVRFLAPGLFSRTQVAEALAALTTFQDKFDLSVRLEWDAFAQNGNGQWKIVANSLADLTNRENRFGHFGYAADLATPARVFPYAAISRGSGYNSPNVSFVSDPEVTPPTGGPAPSATANVRGGSIANYYVNPASYDSSTGRRFFSRPLVVVRGTDAFSPPVTARAVLDGDEKSGGHIVYIVHGFVPLWGERRGQDVMMTDVLAFDLRAYDPGAPLFGVRENPADATSRVNVILEPSDPNWSKISAPVGAYLHANNMNGMAGSGAIGTASTVYPFAGQGAYVDLGYSIVTDPFNGLSQTLPTPRFVSATAIAPWFFGSSELMDTRGVQRSPGYAVYDTWSESYENNGIDDDLILGIDQGTDGLDEPDFRTNAPIFALDAGDIAINGPDDVGERETQPPYDRPLRGLQAVIRVYERDSRQIRQVRVTQHFLDE